MNCKKVTSRLIVVFFLLFIKHTHAQVAPMLPSVDELNKTFSEKDRAAFQTPSKVFYPETWFHFIGGNVSKKGITSDLEAIAGSGMSGMQFFHGQFGGPWPGVEPQITCLSPMWEDALLHTAKECKRLGLRFTMQNCPGWAMSGGPWITPSNAMRHLVWSRTDIVSDVANIKVQLPQPQPSSEVWRDYKDVAVLAFPTPMDDINQPVIPSTVKGNHDKAWKDIFIDTTAKPVRFAAATAGDAYEAEINFTDTLTIRTIEFPSVNSLAHAWNYEPGVKVIINAILNNGKAVTILNTAIPAANFQDNQKVTFACKEVSGAKKFIMQVENQHDMSLGFIRFFTAARKNNWEAEAGWTLRKIDRDEEAFKQSAKTYIDPATIIDITAMVDADGNLTWKTPRGHWTILRIGHVNSGKQNGPAPPEGTGWECNKLSESGANAQFAGYIGRLSNSNGLLGNGILSGMLMDSWECETQTWTDSMEFEFKRISGYALRQWMPALFGYVLKDQQTTFRFLHDWRYTINDLFSKKFYGRMSTLAKQNGLAVSYETSAGDVFPADIMEYYKFADIPMCEFWQPHTKGFVGSLNFKPIKPAASAARLYGKPRLASEAFTSFDLTWNEHFQNLKEVANINMVEGVTHLVYHTYTHNPMADSLKPGTSFGAAIGTPFLRQQTWWKFMPLFNGYFARCSYMLERGKPVSDVLWYLGDEIDHKPDQNYPFPKGFKYDYCNPDVLLNRLSVKDGMIVTPEGVQYRLLWLPSTTHMLPQTLEKLAALIQQGATVVGNAPQSIVTLSGGAASQARFNTAVKNIWGNKQTGIHKSGKGLVIAGTNLTVALKQLKLLPDVVADDIMWTHRTTAGADWYFVCATEGKSFSGSVSFRNSGSVEVWDPVSGKVSTVATKKQGDRTIVDLDLAQAGACFVVFHHDHSSNKNIASMQSKPVSIQPLTAPWSISFPAGWGIDKPIEIRELKSWKDLDLSTEGKAFSGTATYTTTFNINDVDVAKNYIINLGQVDMVAKVMLNGQDIGTVWCTPYQVDISKAVKKGTNNLQIEVTGTWFNRLAYDAALPGAERKTWTISGPAKDAPLKTSGLLGPVVIESFVKNE